MAKKAEPSPLEKWLAGYDRGVERAAWWLEERSLELLYDGDKIGAETLRRASAELFGHVQEIRSET